MTNSFILMVMLALLTQQAHASEENEFVIKNGWMEYHGEAIWGLGQYNGIWSRKSGKRPNITRNAPGKIGPNLTEDLDTLTENMRTYGYPVFEHSFGLWYDRRRDQHDFHCRSDNKVKSPFLEQPWARSETGQACDGLPLYDLEKYNEWYFQRLYEFAKQSHDKGLILFHNYYLQHPLLEHHYHYVDFPWRPGNSIQDTDMPTTVPAASTFFDVSNPVRRKLHKKYIRKVLDTLGGYENVIHFPSAEYTASYRFVRFWMDQIIEWELENPGKDVKIGLAVPKAILDTIMENPARSAHIDVIDLRYFWYKEDGELDAVEHAKQHPGRDYYGTKIQLQSSAQRIYQQTLEYRKRYPDKLISHALGQKKNFMVQFLMAGGSFNVTKLKYPGKNDPLSYIAPEFSEWYPPLYDFVKTNLLPYLGEMTPDYDGLISEIYPHVLASEKALLILAMDGHPVTLNLTHLTGQFRVTMFSTRDSETIEQEDPVYGWQINTLIPPDNSEWLIFLQKEQ